jgi:hypothetical protein
MPNQIPSMLMLRNASARDANVLIDAYEFEIGKEVTS